MMMASSQGSHGALFSSCFLFFLGACSAFLDPPSGSCPDVFGLLDAGTERKIKEEVRRLNHSLGGTF